MSLVQALQNPFERLTLLPTNMGYRGAWDPLEQYFTNEVVIDTLTNSVYILTQVTALTGGDPPSINPLWVNVLSISNTGVISVSGGTGITVDNTVPTQPVVSNAGVVTVSTGLGLQNQSPLSLFPLLANTGVNQIIPSVGISLTGNTLSSTGLVGLQNGTGTLITTNGSSVTVTNSGLLSVNAGANIIVTGTAQNPIISCDDQLITTVVQPFAVMDPETINANLPPPNNFGLISPISTLGIFASYMLSGDPNNVDGTFYLDFSAWSFKHNYITSGIAYVYLALIDATSVPNVTYQIPHYLTRLSPLAGSSINLENVSGSVVPVNLALARAAGIRFVNAISVRLAGTFATYVAANLTVTTSGPVYASYSPIFLAPPEL